MRVGTATADPGEFATGWLTVTTLPTGGEERLPVLIANGLAEGPTLWLTATIHGDEVTGLAAAQDAVDERLVDNLAGAAVCLPTLNPAGLRRNARTSYYHDDDPNRYFPSSDAEQYRPPRVQEVIDRRVYEAITGAPEAPVEDASADALLDLHTAQVGSLPFAIRDRVLYGDRREEPAAESLAETLDALASALGLPIVTEYAGEEYTGEGLHRSTAGAVLNEAGIPALTVELGTHSVVDDRARALGVAACHRALVHLGALEARPDWSPDVGPLDAPVEYRTRRSVHPHTGTAGIVRHRVQPGDPLQSGEAVADIVSPHGDALATVTSDHDGYVLGHQEGVAAYENDPVTHLAVRDDAALIAARDDDP